MARGKLLERAAKRAETKVFRRDRTRLQLSQLFVWGFEGTEVSPSLRRFLKNYPPGGVILFRRNLESLRQVRTLTKGLHALSPSPLIIGIDEEGGRVTRLPKPFEPLPPAAVLGRLYRLKKDPDLLFKIGRSLARELLSLGINTDFAPVLDVDSNPGNPVIGDRAFSDDPKMVAAAAGAFFLGMKKGGVIACGKHFPGHGDTRSDSHLVLPRVKTDRRGLDRVELPPFRAAIRKGIPMLMTAHVVYRALDRLRPATLSAPILQKLLRKEMGFRGVVISDDLTMKAISARHSVVEASLLALEAGVDLLLVCTGGERGEEVVEEIARAASVDRRLRERVDESYRRVLALKKKYLK